MCETRTVSVVIEGRVQGVSYRAWTRSEARARGLTGSVRNRDDGAVEAIFSGRPEAVAEMLTLCQSGRRAPASPISPSASTRIRPA